jgi:hypothetical protein
MANNSSGAHCLAYGNTIDFLQELIVVYSDVNSRLVNSNSHKAEEGGNNNPQPRGEETGCHTLIKR